MANLFLYTPLPKVHQNTNIACTKSNEVSYKSDFGWEYERSHSLKADLVTDFVKWNLKHTNIIALKHIHPFVDQGSAQKKGHITQEEFERLGTQIVVVIDMLQNYFQKLFTLPLHTQYVLIQM